MDALFLCGGGSIFFLGVFSIGHKRASYVEREFSDETSKIFPDCKIWVTNRYQHSGLREDGEKILDTLLGMTRGEVELPS